MNFGSAVKEWLLQLYSHCLATHKLPEVWKKAHVMALLKPEKDPSAPKNYRPISLLNHTYKLIERLLLNRIGPTVDDLLVSDLAGFTLTSLQQVKYLTSTDTLKMALKKGK